MHQKYNFENLEVYRLARDLVREIYEVSKNFPREEIFVLTSQLRRAAISVLLNIAEGSIKSKKEFARFVDISTGSLLETKTCLDIAADLKYIHQDKLRELVEKIDQLFFKLLSLRKYLKK